MVIKMKDKMRKIREKNSNTLCLFCTHINLLFSSILLLVMDLYFSKKSPSFLKKFSLLQQSVREEEVGF